MDSGSEQWTLHRALLVLQTPSAPFGDRLHALRCLSAFAQQGKAEGIDESTRSNINKIMFDSLLELVMSEDRTADLRTRQLIRTECFIMLANVLKSRTLFGDAYSQIQISEMFGRLNAEVDESISPIPASKVSGGGGGSSSPARAVPRAHSASRLEFPEGKGGGQFPEGKGGGGPDVRSEGAAVKLSQSAVFSLDSEAATGDEEFGRAERGGLSPSRHSMGTRHRSSRAHPHPRKQIVYETLQAKYQQTKVAHMRDIPGMKPRQGVIFGSAYDKEHFVPGSDPTNWTEQDRKLGFRKERMWFPFSVGINKSIVPLARESNAPHALEPQQIVKEYQQMRALMSYVGDMVLIPPEGAVPTLGKAHGRGTGPSPLEQGRYDRAVREAVQMWTPLLGAHLPPYAKKLLLAHADKSPPLGGSSSKKNRIGTGAVSLESPPKVVPSTSQRKMDSSQYDAPARAPAHAENSVLLTKSVLKQLRLMESKGSDRTKASIRG